jgi:hypothetical protein
MTTESELLEILRIGTTAISPYNTQPWRFRVTDTRIDVFIIRTKNFFLKLQGVSHMTLGCLLENLVLGARSIGHKATIQLFDRPLGLDEPCASVELEPDPAEIHVSVDHVLARSTNRKLYRRDPLPAEVRERIAAAAVDDNVTLHCSEGQDVIRLARILADLESVRLSNFKMTREALEFIRRSEAEMRAKPEGLDVRTLELGDSIVSMLGSIQRPGGHRLLKLLGMVRTATRRHHQQLVHSAAILTYAISDRQPHSFVGLGRIIQRTLNALAESGLESMSVLSGLYLLDVLRSNPEIFSRRETQRLSRARRALEQFFATSEENIAFVVRTGFAAPPSFRQLRRPVEELLLS